MQHAVDRRGADDACFSVAEDIGSTHIFWLKQTPAGWENLALKLGLDATDVPRTLSPEQLPR